MRNDFIEISTLLLKNYKINCIYDIGANNGDWTRKHSALFKNSKFYLFEGNPKLEKPEIPCDWFNVLLSDKDNKEVIFHTINNTGDSYYREQTILYEGANNAKKISTRSLDQMIKDYNMPLPDIIKVDTQGSEVDIFKGAKNALNNCKLVLTETPIIAYNKGAPMLNEYIEILKQHLLVPVGIEEIHILDNTLVQMDIVFIKKYIKDNIFGKATKIKDSLIEPIKEAKKIYLG